MLKPTAGYTAAKTDEDLVNSILKLKKEKKALILAHNYQRPEVQDIADYVDDSVGLAKKAVEDSEAQVIVHCSVDFMAETAMILNPEKKVLMPSLGARCPMAAMLPAFLIPMWRQKYPGVPIVLYVNTYAEAKAKCDVCCTSANAVEVVQSLDSDTVIFGPDANLAWYVKQKTGKKLIPIPDRGFCQTHVLFLKDDVLLLKEENPQAVVMAHPECSPEVQKVADFVGSTSQMCTYAKNSTADKFIVATEVGILHRLQREVRQKTFIPAYEGALCVNMKLNTLQRIYLALKEDRYRVQVPRDIARKAKVPLEKMFEVMNLDLEAK
jgi:quinolinate synthase